MLHVVEARKTGVRRRTAFSFGRPLANTKDHLAVAETDLGRLRCGLQRGHARKGLLHALAQFQPMERRETMQYKGFGSDSCIEYQSGQFDLKAPQTFYFVSLH